MNLSDLLASEVVDDNGSRLGTVEDVRVVQDGPLLLPFGAAFRIDALVVGRHTIAIRLGYERGGIRGPWLLRGIFRSLERRAHVIEWADVIDWDGRTVRVTARE
jgi:PRC-barrel domain